MARIFTTSASGYFFYMTSEKKDIDARIAERVEQLGRKLTTLELIEIINEPDPDEPNDLIYEIDEEQ
jgi:hypothetical protein